jgi:hypothetical protein
VEPSLIRQAYWHTVNRIGCFFIPFHSQLVLFFACPVGASIVLGLNLLYLLFKQGAKLFTP